jgi:hypothetical protein
MLPAVSAASARSRTEPLKVDHARLSVGSTVISGSLRIENRSNRQTRPARGAIEWRRGSDGPLVELKRFAIPAIASHGIKTIAVKGSLSASTAAGTYALLACLDVTSTLAKFRSSTGCARVGETTIAAHPSVISGRPTPGKPPPTPIPIPTLVPQPQAPSTAPASTVSDGGTTTVELDGITVQAPAGAIAAGQTLSLTRGDPDHYFPEGAPSLIGGPILVTTSQGEPSGPVTVVYRYDSSQFATGEHPLLLHGFEALHAWLPEPTGVDAANGVATATLDSFSPIDWVNDGTYYAGRLTGNRSSLPDDCGDAPDWVSDVSLPNSSEAPLNVCFSEEGSEEAVLHLVNNRGYPQTLRITGTDFDLDDSSWGDSLEEIVANALAKVGTDQAKHTIILGPGEDAHLTIERPADQPSTQAVTIDPKATFGGATAFGAVGWSVLAATKEQVGLPAGFADCVIAAVASAKTAEPDPTLEAIRHCSEVAAGAFSTSAGELLKKITFGLAVDDFFYKAVDVIFDQDFPAFIGFDVPGTGVLDSDIHVGPANVGPFAAGETSVAQLDASGGTAPYEYHLYTPPGDSAPSSWVTVSSSGTLTVSPPADAAGTITVHVYAFDSSRRHEPFARDTVTFTVGDDPAAVPASDLGVHGTDAGLACVDPADCVTLPFANYVSGGEIARVTRADAFSPWQQSEPIQVPAYDSEGGVGVYPANVSGIGCESDGACTVVGTANESLGSYYHGSFTATEREGEWIAGESIPAVASADGSTTYNWTPEDIACGASSCTVTGYAGDANFSPVAMSGSDGVWNAPYFLPTPADYSPYQSWGGRSFETAASCPGSGSSCVIGYIYAQGSPDHYGPTGYGWATVIEDGNGSRVQADGVLAGQLSPQINVQYVHLACTSVEHCLAAWTDYVPASNGTDLVSKAFASTEVDGVWNAAAMIDQPAAIAQPDAGSAAFGVGCADSGTCYVQTGYTPGAEQVDSALILDFVPWHADGEWGAARPISVPHSSGDALRWYGIWCADTCAGIGNAYAQGASQESSWIAPIADFISP